MVAFVTLMLKKMVVVVVVTIVAENSVYSRNLHYFNSIYCGRRRDL